MNGKVEQQSTGSSVDTVKLLAALLILVAGVVGYYWFAETGHFAIRFAGLVVCLVAAGVIAAFTGPGRALVGFFSETRFELRKVAWPSRQETVQTTIMVMIVVVIISILLWLIDMLLAWIVRGLVGV
ncbi:preprotein translocase subunit SecE [Pseudofulvimonas gallinarii]|jgi:preprotein translocase subunit SecE|uniref:Protein translocase subunit SecE n=1 Tax=Pseudofulvimonas gallinarii TaxID=634155 RepID=A0A4R3LJ70_9GAMM|nr:preprotein translocase subunit SecE [Pseudofulvimonas gallinarii]TCS98554.1 protein translocase subunit secE/sec61 gamma [Pseudofulvimonas gallinarii]THD12390.1 preprotein translocase subunit SecE [Pseudofulvimonas gallinarii]